MRVHPKNKKLGKLGSSKVGVNVMLSLIYYALIMIHLGLTNGQAVDGQGGTIEVGDPGDPPPINVATEPTMDAGPGIGNDSGTLPPPGAGRHVYSRRHHRPKFALAGRVLPFLSHFLVTPELVKDIYHALSRAVDAGDLLALTLLGWATVPAIHIPYSILMTKKQNLGGHKSAAEDMAFKRTYLFHIAHHISKVAKLSILVYAVDCLSIVLPAMGFDAQIWNDGLSQVFAKIVYTLLAAERIKVLKRHLIHKALSGGADELGASLVSSLQGKALVLNHIANFVIYVVSSLLVMDMLSVHMGVALSSIFAFGGVGTLVVSLAAKDMASLVISGLVLTVSDKFHQGEYVKLGDGTSGTVLDVGWTDTSIRASNELVIKIPNSQLTGQRIYNYSRIKQCQVSQKMRFKYEDAQKLPKVIADIKEEIRQSCGDKLIDDGTRPFRVVLRDFMDDHILVSLDARFRLKPIGDDYWNNRQEVLVAVERAVSRNQIAFVQTTSCSSSNLN